ncbi:TonB-dependent receptor [Bryobacter aggregatus]|uniref:TonB-dependent receptor n=1 Tax=Bryobacter aggregatus TaxID=360054 RepID=UPI00138E29A7|nr:TonB-dependent receptor [Bryobacter aggregatus]
MTCLIAFGQSEVGGASLNGTILDPSGATVSQAKVTATNTNTGFTRSTESSDAGVYTFVRLPVGLYRLSIEKNGFKSYQKSGIELTVGAVRSFDATLEIGAMTETTSVTAELPVVETARVSTSTTVNEKEVRDLPINGRNFLDFTILTPGVVRDQTRGGDLSFGGQRGTANSVLVDGGDANNLFFGQSSGRAGGGRNPYTFSQDAVQEFQVNTSGYAPEIGRAGGGVINMVTKSGGNDFHGTGFWFFRDRELNANTPINKARGVGRQPYHFNQFGGNLGGPIKKDKLFFFFNYDGQRNTNPNPVFFPIAPLTDADSQRAVATLTPLLRPYVTGQRNNIYTGRIDYNISSTQQLNVRFNAHRFQGTNFENSGNQSAAEHTGNSNISSDNLSVGYNKVFGSTTIWDSRFVYLRDDEPGLANSTSPEAVIRQSGTTMLSIGRNSFSPRYTNSKKYNFINTVSAIRSTHTLKAGADVNIERIANYFPGNFGGSYTFNSLADFANGRPVSFTQGFAGPGTRGATTYPNASEVGLFFQDTWRVVDRLTLTYGVRYDLFKLASNDFRNPDPGLAALGLRTDVVPFNKDNILGRFGLAYRLDKTGRSVIRAGFGMFAQRTPAIMYGTAHSQNGVQVQTYTLSSTVPSQAGLIPAYPAILSAPPALARTPDIYVMDPTFRTAQTYQWNFNYERQLARDFAMTLGYLGVKGLHLSRSRDINLFPTVVVNATLSTTGAQIPYATRLSTARPNPNFGRITVFESGADSSYHGGFVQFSKRYSKNFQLQSSYTYSKVIDSRPDATSVVVGGGDDAKVVQDTLNPNADRGLGDANIKHRFVGSGVWDIAYFNHLTGPKKLVFGGWQLSVIFQAQSGRPFNATAPTDLNNDQNSRNDRAPGFGRNTIIGPNFASLDLRVSKDIPVFREKVRLRLMGEAFNALNRANFSGLQTSPYSFVAATRTLTPQTSYLSNTASFDPRILQIAARITF